MKYYACVMSERRKATSGYPHFMTLTVVNWIDLFTRRRYCELILDSLDYCTDCKDLQLFAYVIMPSHIHLIARCPELKMSGLLKSFKSYTAKAIYNSITLEPGESRRHWLVDILESHAGRFRQNKHFMLWQKTNYPIELDYDYIFDQKLAYIHNNPVAAGYVTDPSSWKYSSANLNQRLKLVALY